MIPLLLTRPRDRSEAFIAGLPRGLQDKVSPFFAQLWQMEGTAPAPDFDAAIFTSVNGVHFGPKSRNRPAYCVGKITTAAARAAGWNAQQVGETAMQMIRTLRQMRPSGQLLHLSGAQHRGDVAEQLAEAGLNTARHITYVQHALPLPNTARELLNKGPVLVPLFSKNGAEHFAAEASTATAVYVAAISPATAQSLGNFRAKRVAIAQSPDAQSLGVALESLATDLLAG